MKTNALRVEGISVTPMNDVDVRRLESVGIAVEGHAGENDIQRSIWTKLGFVQITDFVREFEFVTGIVEAAICVHVVFDGVPAAIGTHFFDGTPAAKERKRNRWARGADRGRKQQQNG